MMSKDEFGRAVMAAEQTLYNVAKTMLIRESDCEDAVSEAVLIAFSRLGSLREERYFKTWLVRILINECNKRLRNKKITVPFEEYMASEPAPEAEDYSDLYLAMTALPPKVRTAVVLYYIEGYSLEETGSILKIPKGTVKSRLARGRELLKEKLKDE